MVNRLIARHKNYVKDYHEEAVRKEVLAERLEQIENPTVAAIEAIPEESAEQEVEKPAETEEETPPSGMLAGPVPITATAPMAETYCMIKPTDVVMPLHREKFYEAGYAPVLEDLIVTTEGPILEDNLVKRIATAHGFTRTGRRIQAVVLKRVRRNYATTSENVGAFFWPKGIDPDRWQGCRRPQTSADFRAPNGIPTQELTALAAECRFEQDPPVAMARKLGIARLSTLHRERLTQALGKVLEQ